MNPKSFPIALIAAVVFVGALFAPVHSGGQTGEEINTTQLLTEVTTQQTTIADNQAKIDAKLASVGENLRQARIFAGRGR